MCVNITLTNWLIEHYNHMKVIHFILRQVYAVEITGEIPQLARAEAKERGIATQSPTRAAAKTKQYL